MIKILIPATSANLGAGFDSLGVALNHYNYVSMEEYDGISIRSLDEVKVPQGERNLIYRSAKSLYELCGRNFAGLRLEQTNNIPMARGLGSSSACIVAGLVGANYLMGNPLSKDELIDLAANMEGHPDNVTPAILGGLVTAVIEDGKVYYVKQHIKDDLTFVAIVPDFELKTSLARAVLPGEISLEDGVYNLSRAALMAISLQSGNYQNLRVATGDRLHQLHRMPLIDGGQEVIDACYNLGAYGAYISGAGSTLMAIVDSSNQEFTDKLREKLDEMEFTSWKIIPLKVDNQGANVVPIL